jgi:RimJ/RimL family protein N-acetyltransferase
MPMESDPRPTLPLGFTQHPFLNETAILEGRWVRLEPLSSAHIQALSEIDDLAGIFRWFPKPVHNLSDMQEYTESALAAQQAGLALPFATIALSTGKIVGSTRFMAIDRLNRRVEIGSTWLNTAWQKTRLNSEAKYLMLAHAFERSGAVRVEFKTDAHNAKSRAALIRLGAIEEGVLRNHMITSAGRLRDSVYFSITHGEWPRVKAQLERRLAI